MAKKEVYVLPDQMIEDTSEPEVSGEASPSAGVGGKDQSAVKTPAAAPVVPNQKPFVPTYPNWSPT